MRLEWQLLRADYHLREYPVALKEASRRCRALQTKRFFPVPDTGHVDRRTNAFYCVRSGRHLSHRIVANFVVERLEIASRQVEIELNQPQVRFQNKKRHGAHLHSHSQPVAGGENLGSSSGRRTRFVLFDEVRLLQVLEKFPEIVLHKFPADSELAANLIDNH